MSFAELGLEPRLLTAIETKGYTQLPTPPASPVQSSPVRPKHFLSPLSRPTNYHAPPPLFQGFYVQKRLRCSCMRPTRRAAAIKPKPARWVLRDATPRVPRGPLQRKDDPDIFVGETPKKAYICWIFSLAIDVLSKYLVKRNGHVHLGTRVGDFCAHTLLSG